MKSIINTPELIEALNAVWDRGNRLVGNLSPTEFNNRVFKGKWNIAEEFNHIVRANSGITSSLNKEEQFFAQFGKNDGVVRDYQSVVDGYENALAEYTKTRTPRIFSPKEGEELVQKDILFYWNSSQAKFNDRITRWSDELLDTRQIPHPLLGPLPVREMLFFTIHHSHHHLDKIEEKKEAIRN